MAEVIANGGHSPGAVNEVVFPFSWVGWDKQDELFNTYYDVDFTADFGPIKSGSRFESVDVNYADGQLTARHGDELTKVVWRAVAVQE